MVRVWGRERNRNGGCSARAVLELAQDAESAALEAAEEVRARTIRKAYRPAVSHRSRCLPPPHVTSSLHMAITHSVSRGGGQRGEVRIADLMIWLSPLLWYTNEPLEQEKIAAHQEKIGIKRCDASLLFNGLTKPGALYSPHAIIRTKHTGRLQASVRSEDCLFSRTGQPCLFPPELSGYFVKTSAHPWPGDRGGTVRVVALWGRLIWSLCGDG
jgi:hypothetical protein